MRRRILVAIDESEASSRVAEFVNEFFTSDDVDVIALHVTSTTAAVPPAALGPGAGLWWAYPAPGAAGTGYVLSNETGPQPLAEADSTDDERGREVVGSSGLHADRIEVEMGDPVEAIIHVADEEDVSIIVVGSNNRGWFDRLVTGGSVSRELARSSTRPVLIV